MVERYNERVENQGLEPEDMRAICIDPDDDLREFEAKFDVAVVSARGTERMEFKRLTKRFSALRRIIISRRLKRPRASSLAPSSQAAC